MSGLVYVNREHPVTPEGTITIFDPVEEVDDMGYADGEPFLSLDLVIEVRAGGAGAVSAAQTVTTLAGQVEAAILRSSDLAQLAIAVMYVGSVPSFEALETQIAMVTVTFRVLCREDIVAEETPLVAPEISAVTAEVGIYNIAIECDTDRDCCVQFRAHKAGSSAYRYSVMESVSKTEEHSWTIAGLLHSTTYIFDVRAEPSEGPSLQWASLTDGVEGSEWTTLPKEPIVPEDP
jgi:hypothetical protein